MGIRDFSQVRAIVNVGHDRRPREDASFRLRVAGMYVGRGGGDACIAHWTAQLRGDRQRVKVCSFPPSDWCKGGRVKE